MNAPTTFPAAIPAQREPFSARDYHFDLKDCPRWWHGGDPAITAFFNALSLTFPEGERFFINAVRTIAGEIGRGSDPEIRAFVQQEAIHTREHLVLNEQLAAQGYPVDLIEARLSKDLALAYKHLPPLRRLAATCALEHFTAIFAEQLLGDERFLANVPKEVSDMWRWHAIEEIEHKAVAFDLYRQATANKDQKIAEQQRLRAMRITTVMFSLRIFRNTFTLLRADGLAFSWKAWARLYKFLFVKDGFIARIVPAWKAYFRADFHPWQFDDRHLIALWESRLARAA